MEAVKEFASWKYDTGSHKKAWFIFAAIVSFVAALFLSANVSPYFMLMLSIPLLIVFHLWRADYDRGLMLSNRYIIIGEEIVYFRNLSSARLEKDAESLTLFWGKGRSLVVASSRFPTNARKPDKIRLNRSAKFSKVSEKILSKLELNGVKVTTS